MKVKEPATIIVALLRVAGEDRIEMMISYLQSIFLEYRNKETSRIFFFFPHVVSRKIKEGYRNWAERR